MASRLLSRCALLIVLASRDSARAQAMPDPGEALELIESTERSEDPLGLDPSTGSDLERAAARLPKATLPLPTPTQGAALSSIEGVREVSHEVALRLEAGLAFVRVQLRLASQAKHAAEVAYRLPLPASAVITRVEACRSERCSQASPAAPSVQPGPSLSAESIHDARGHALSLRVAPVAPGGAVRVEVEYVAEAPLHGGTVRFSLPARGEDPNLSPGVLRFDAGRLTDLAPARTLSLPSSQPLTVSARLPSQPARVAHEVHAPCGTAVCSRRYEAAAARTLVTRPTWLLLDASPSMEGPARGRAEAALAALLSVLPERTPLRVVAFAAEARDLGRYEAGSAPLRELADALLAQLGASTWPSSALALARAESERVKPRFILLTDGQLDPTAREQKALRTMNGERWLVALGDRPPTLREPFTIVRPSERADAALRSGELGPLAEQLAVVAARPLDSTLRAGEQRVREVAPDGRWPLRADSPWLAFWLARARPAPRWTARGQAAPPPFLAALPYASAPAPRSAEATSMPAETVLSMLRTQLVPQARACLRSDRRGRADYAVGLTFHALFAEREVYEGRVEGALPAALRSCLEALLPRLRVPAFTGRIRVRYPIHTQREPPPPTLELEPDVREQVDRALSASPELR